jgi:hypothetical protein
MAYGQPSDLKGLKKIFVDTGTDMKSRATILDALQKSKLDFEIVDDADSAEIVLGFGASKVSRRTIANTTRTETGSSTAVYDIQRRAGAGLVMAHARGKDRLVYSFTDVQKNIFEGKPVNNFVKEFIKLYKKANGI